MMADLFLVTDWGKQHHNVSRNINYKFYNRQSETSETDRQSETSERKGKLIVRISFHAADYRQAISERVEESVKEKGKPCFVRDWQVANTMLI
jgi:hypothetical protein